MWSDFGRLQKALIGLLVGTTILFAIGIAVERAQQPVGDGGSAVGEPTPSGETTEEGGGHSEEGEGHSGTGESGEAQASEERFLGIDYEAPCSLRSRSLAR